MSPLKKYFIIHWPPSCIGKVLQSVKTLSLHTVLFDFFYHSSVRQECSFLVLLLPLLCDFFPPGSLVGGGGEGLEEGMSSCFFNLLREFSFIPYVCLIIFGVGREGLDEELM